MSQPAMSQPAMSPSDKTDPVAHEMMIVSDLRQELNERIGGFQFVVTRSQWSLILVFSLIGVYYISGLRVVSGYLELALLLGCLPSVMCFSYVALVAASYRALGISQFSIEELRQVASLRLAMQIRANTYYRLETLVKMTGKVVRLHTWGLRFGVIWAILGISIILAIVLGEA